jgi:hypothetical protein
LKVSGEKNWSRLPEIIRKVEDARAAGLQITADMYTYPAGATPRPCNAEAREGRDAFAGYQVGQSVSGHGIAG